MDSWLWDSGLGGVWRFWIGHFTWTFVGSINSASLENCLKDTHNFRTHPNPQQKTWYQKRSHENASIIRKSYLCLSGLKTSQIIRMKLIRWELKESRSLHSDLSGKLIMEWIFLVIGFITWDTWMDYWLVCCEVIWFWMGFEII